MHERMSTIHKNSILFDISKKKFMRRTLGRSKASLHLFCSIYFYIDIILCRRYKN